MKKKVIFMVINMNIGGTEKALLSMIEEMDMSKWDVTILMLEKYGDFLEEIPTWVKVKYVENYKEIKPLVQDPPFITVKRLVKEKQFIKGASIALNYGLSKMFKNLLIWYRYILREIKILDEVYDVAVAYAGPMDLITTFVSYKISATTKVQWIHFDVSKVTFDEGIVKALYPKFNKIFVVSEEGKNKLKDKFPFLQAKLEVLYNTVSKNKILEAAKQGETFNDSFTGIRILTVGRLSREKGQDLIIPVSRRLKDYGYNVRWYCIGDGAYRNRCLDLIEKHNVESDFILLGSKKNPYPYMKDCDIYVQPSRHEGYCITLAEAKCFDKPILATNFTGAVEQLEKQDRSVVCEITQDSIYEGIKKILENKEFYL